MIAVFLNLFFNATFSLLVGLLVVMFFLWLFRVETGPWKVFLLSLPFVKIVFDVVNGIPENSILLAGLDPFNLPPKHQILRLGLGFREWIPTLDVTFSVQGPHGIEYAASIGDYLVIWLYKQFGFLSLEILAITIVGVAIFFMAIRLWKALQFERLRKLDRQLRQPFKIVNLGFRKIDVYVSPIFTGTPFTGGIFEPYICFPQDAFEQLNSDEREAVIFHELGHISQFDLLVTLAVQVLGDLFWFIPGYRLLSRKIDRLREMVADQWAVKKGAQPELLANALVKLQEVSQIENRYVLYSAFFREKSLLKTRVDRLLGKTLEMPSRFGWKFKIVRIMVSLWILLVVSVATFGGNHPL